MAQDSNDIKWLYGKLKSNGLNIGSEADFTSSLANSDDRKWYYEKAKGMGLKMGSMADFDGIYAPKNGPSKKEKDEQVGQPTQQPSQSDTQMQGQRLATSFDVKNKPKGSVNDVLSTYDWGSNEIPGEDYTKRVVEDYRINKTFAPKKVESTRDIQDNYASMFALTENGEKISNEYAAAEKAVTDKYVNEFAKSNELSELAKKYKGKGKQGEGQFQNEANDLFMKIYGHRIEDELKPYNDAYNDALMKRYGFQIDDETGRFQKRKVAERVTELGKKIEDDINLLKHENAAEISGDGDTHFSSNSGEVRKAGGSRTHDWHTPARSEKFKRNQRDLTLLENAKKLNSNSVQMIDEAGKKDSSWYSAMGRGLRDSVFDVDTWTFGITELSRNLNIKDVAEKADRGEKLTKGEEALMDACVANMATQAYYSSDLSASYRAGQTTGTSIPFMLEFAVNPVASAGNAFAKSVLRYGMKKFGTFASMAARRSAKVGARLVGDALAAGAMTATTGAPRVASGTVERMKGDIQFDQNENGELSYAGRENRKGRIGEALAKSYASQFIENQSEMIFNPFQGTGGIVLGAIGKGFEKVGKKLPGLASGYEKAMNWAANTPVAEVYRAVNNNKKFKEIMKATQFHGYPEEYLEEVYNNFANVALGEMSIEDATSLEQNLDTMYGLAPTSVAFAVLGVGMTKVRHDIERRRKKAYREFLRQLSDDDLRVVESLKNEYEVREYVKSVIGSSRLTVEQKKAALKTAYNHLEMLAAGQLRGEVQEDENEESDAYNGGTEQPMSEDEAGAADIYDRARLTWDGMEKGDPNAQVDFDAISMRMKEAYRMLEDAFGTDAEMRIAEIQEDPWGMVNDPELTEDQRDAALYYIKAKAAMDGVQDASNDSMESKRREVPDAYSVGAAQDHAGNYDTERRRADLEDRLNAVAQGVAGTIDGLVDSGASAAEVENVISGLDGNVAQDARDYYHALLSERGAIDNAIDDANAAADDFGKSLEGVTDADGNVTTANYKEEAVNVLADDGEHATIVHADGRKEVVLSGDLEGVMTTSASSLVAAERRRLIDNAVAEMRNRFANHPNTREPEKGMLLWNGDVPFLVGDVRQNGDGTMTVVAFPAVANGQGQMEIKKGSTPVEMTREEAMQLQNDYYDRMDDANGRSGRTQEAEAGGEPPMPGAGEDAGRESAQANAQAVEGRTQSDNMIENKPQNDGATAGGESTVQNRSADDLSNSEEAKEESPRLVTNEDGTPDFIASGEDASLTFLNEKYKEKAGHKIEVTRKAADEKLKKAENALNKAQQAYDDAPIGAEDKAEAALNKAMQAYDDARKEADFWTAMGNKVEGNENKLVQEEIKLSEEIDENGRQFVLTPNGELAFGEIDEKSGLTAAPILLSEGMITNPATNDGYGLVHIEARHGEQIRKAGYKSVIDFIQTVAKNYEVIKEGNLRDGRQTYRLQLTDKHNNTLMVELSGDGTYWNINTAGIFKTSYGKKNKEVYNRHTTAKQSVETAETSQGTEHGDTQAPSSMNVPTSSGNKDSNPADNKQGTAEKIASAEAEVDTNPTEAQKEAGNYKKGHVRIDGHDITIEQPKGSVRRGTDADGKQWESEMHNTYGYIRGTEGVDGDHIDVFLSDNPTDGNVYVIDQVNPKTGEFDEHKVMYGFASAEEAKAAYLSNYGKGWKGLGGITEVSREEFKKWIGSSRRKTKPFAEYKGVKQTESGTGVSQQQRPLLDVPVDVNEWMRQHPGQTPASSDLFGEGQSKRQLGKELSRESNTGDKGVTLTRINYEGGYVLEARHGSDFVRQSYYPDGQVMTSPKVSIGTSSESFNKYVRFDGNGLAYMNSNEILKSFMDAVAEDGKKGEKGGKFDSQGNPINNDGTLKLEKVQSVDDLTDEDFSNPTRSVQLPKLPKNVDSAIGADGKPAVIKKNIFERNSQRHPDISAKESRDILLSALYSPDLFGQNQKAKRPYNWIVINTKDSNGKNRTVLLEINPSKDNVEIVHWHYIDKRGLEKIKRQAEREDGQLLILPSEHSEEAGALSSPTNHLPSTDKVTNNQRGAQEKGSERFGEADEVAVQKLMYPILINFKKNPQKAREGLAALFDGFGDEELDATARLTLQTRITTDEKGVSNDDWRMAAVEAVESLLGARGVSIVKGSRGLAEGDVFINKDRGLCKVVERKGNGFVVEHENGNLIDIKRSEVKYHFHRNAVKGSRNGLEEGGNTQGSASAEGKKKGGQDSSGGGSPQGKGAFRGTIDDVGEKIEGARKDMLRDYAKSIGNANVESFVALPLSKAFKRPDLKKLVEEGALREKDARFAEAVMACYLSQGKPRMKTGSRYAERESSDAIRKWAEKCAEGAEILRTLFTTEDRDGYIEEIRQRKAYDEEAVMERKRKLAEWNPGKKFEGTCYGINPVALFMDVYDRLGYEAGDVKLPIVNAVPDSMYDSYELVAPNGKKFYPSQALASYEDVVNEIVYQTKRRNGDESNDHPASVFRVRKSEPIEEVSGYRVLSFPSIRSTKPSERPFSTKEEADAFAKEYMESHPGGYATVREERRTKGYGKFSVVYMRSEGVNNSEYTYQETGMEFDTEEEARAAIEQRHDELNEIANSKDAELASKSGEVRRKRDYLRIQYYSEDGKTWKYAIVLDDRYNPHKTAWNTMPYALADGFTSRKDAEKYIEEHRAEWDEKIADIDRQRRELVYFDGDAKGRIGKDYRNGQDVTAEQFAAQFGFRGVQFGNWANQRDRQAALNNAFDAFMDLAGLLGVSPRAISLNGELGIAFGARGSGNASAHYEREQVVINLTKTQGAGSLAHEWWHALDNYFGRQGGVAMGMATKSKSIAMRSELRDAFNALIDHVAESGYDKRSAERGRSYWGTRVEETARLFETWVDNELRSRGERNNFLVGKDPDAENRIAQANYDFYVWSLNGSEKEPMSFEEFKKTPMALAGYVYPSSEELETLGGDLRRIFDTVQERVDAETGNVVMYHRGGVVTNTSAREDALRDAIVDTLRESGMEVITDVEEGQRVLDEVNGDVKKMAFGEPYDYEKYPLGRVKPNLAEKDVEVVEADANHGFTNYKNAKVWAKRNVAKVYDDEETGGKGNVRISNTAIDKFMSQSAVDKSDSKDVHMAVLKVLPDVLKSSIDVETHPDFLKGEDGKRKAENGMNKDVLVHRCYGAVTIDGKPYRVKITLKENIKTKETTNTHSYEATKIELLAGQHGDVTMTSPRNSNSSISAAKLLENVVMSYNPNEKVLDASKKRSESIREQRVYHGSGAEFDHFDHSHMGEGEGQQAYGWGTYVTEVEGIGRTYAAAATRNLQVRISGLELDIEKTKERLPFIKGQYKDDLQREIEQKQQELEQLRQQHQRHLYTVEIPDDTGENYLSWDEPLTDGQIGRIRQYLSDNYRKNKVEDFDASIAEVKNAPNASEVNAWSRRGENIYKTLKSLLGTDREASKALSEMGFVGIKYPADYLRGGREDGKSNYVIFNEKDAKITDHVRFFRTSNGEAYGFTVGGRIYIDPRIANSETPVHEYAHLWATALREGNAKEWENVVKLMKGTSLWEEVKKRYPELETDDEVADEVLAHYSGRRGAERLREAQRKALEENKDTLDAAAAVSAIQRVRRALAAFWKSVADFLHIHYTSAEEVADRVMKDLLDGVDPRKFGKGGVNDKARMSAKKRRALETASLGDTPRSLTVVPSADGAKILKNIDTLVSEYENSATQPKTFLGEVAKALGAKRHGSASEYATFETKNGRIVTIRLANHNAKVSNFDANGEDEGISIVVSPKRNERMAEGGKAHVMEYFYDAIKLRRADGKPLADIVRSIKQALYSGEFKDTTGLAEQQEVNAKDVVRYSLMGESGEAADRAEEDAGNKFRLLDEDDPKVKELEALPEGELVPVYRNVQAFSDDALGSPMAFFDAKTGERRTLQGQRWNYSEPPQIQLTDEQQRKLDELDKNGYLMVDGKKTTELPITDGLKFVKPKTKEAQLQYLLKKNPEDSGTWAAYDPYDHAVETPLNTQFAEAYKRPNLVVVRSLIPKSEITEPFHADYALLPTGAHQWNNGRTLYLSRWSKIDKVLTREEEAKLIDEYWKKNPGKREALKTHRDYNRFVPEVRKELEKMGYRFEHDGKVLTPEESLALDAQRTQDVIPGMEGHLPYITGEDIERINAKMSGKWVGEPKKAMENEMAARVEDLSKKLNTPVRIVRTDEEVAALPTSRQRRQKGSFNTVTGEVTVVVPNNANLADVENTFMHEVIGHDGLRVLFPTEEKLNKALDELYRVSDDGIKATIDRMAQRMYDAEVNRLLGQKRKAHEADGSNASYYEDMAEAHVEAGKKREQFKRDATEEYGADLAGRIGEKGFEKMSADELTFWGKLKAMLQKALDRLLQGLGIPGRRKWGDKEWSFVLHEAYKRKKNGGRPSVFDVADTEVMKRRTGFDETDGRKADGRMSDNERFNSELTRYQNGDMDKNEMLHIGKPQGVMRQFVPDLPIVMRQRILKKGSVKKHNVDVSALANMPKHLSNPIFVFQRSDNALGVFTEMQDRDGRNVCVAIEMNRQIQNGGDMLEVNDIRSVHGRNITDIVYPIIQNGTLKWADKEKGLAYLSSASRYVQQEIDKQDLNTAAKIVENFENPNVLDENIAGDEELMFRDGDMGLDETITKMKLDAAAANADNWHSKQEAMKAIGGNLDKLRKAMARQKEYDLSTVKSITDLAKLMLEHGLLDDLSRYETKRILSAVNNAHGRQDVSGQVQKVVDIMVDNQLRMGANSLGRLLSIRGSRVDARGIEVQGQLDPDGQTIAQVVRKATSLPKEDIEERINDTLDRMGSDDQAVADEAALENAGLLIAHQYAEDITGSKAEEKALRDSLKQAKEDLDAGMMDKDAYDQYVEATNDAIRQNKIERAGAYRDIVERVGGVLGESVERAKAWREAEKRRVEEIHHNANSDMQGRPCDEHHKESKMQKIANNSFVRFLLAPLGTFDQMLRMFGSKSVNGEGYLYNRYMRGWVDATEKEYTGYKNALKTLDGKVSEVFGKKMKWGDLFAMERKLPKATVTFWDGGEQKAHELTQGNLLYIYMVDKMADGRMKLRRMGITEEDVENIKDFIEPCFLELADWMQDEFLVQKRNDYNEVHKRMFGASMAAIENYFPLKILANARTENVDVADETSDTALPATSTGSIIKRKRNNLALDVMGADAFSVILDHIQQMERWASFAEFNRDLNTLLSYKHFRNQVMNMASVYGGGKTLWNNFRNVCSMAAGAYRPPVAPLDKAAVNIAKGVTAAKVSFRVFTALKQFLSMPAYLSDSNPVHLAANIANPIGAWKWCMENLPLSDKRWSGRMSGDPRLMKSEMDWKMWQNHVVEIASRIGMSPNAFVDALTVSIGAHSMYQTKKQKYLRYGYDEDTAEKRARQDATILFNQTQQSGESAFLSTMQADRSWLSVLFTVFRNSSMSYTRQLFDAIRNLKRRFEPGYKGLTEEFMAKQMRRDGIDPDKADANAKHEYRRSLLRDIARVGVFGYALQLAWNLGAYLPYLLFGDDKDEKSDMWHDIFCHTMFGNIEGITGGDVISAVGNDIVQGKGLSSYSATKDMPLASDLESIYKKWNKDKVAAMNDVVNLLVQSGVGVNPQSLTDAVVAIMDYCGDDARTSRECALLITRIINCPQSQIDKIYFDEIRASAKEAGKMTPAQIAERYARYKMRRNAPLTGWAYTEAERDILIAKQKDKMLKDAKHPGGRAKEKRIDGMFLKNKNIYDEVKVRLSIFKKEKAASKGNMMEYAGWQKKENDLKKTKEYKIYLVFKKKQKALKKRQDNYNKKGDDATRDALYELKDKMNREVYEIGK